MCSSFCRTLFFPSQFSKGFGCNGPWIRPLCPPHFQWHHTITQSHSPSYILVHIKQSKTDPFRQGHTTTIAKSLSPICLVMAMKDYLHQATLCSSSSNPDNGLNGTISQQLLGQFFNTVVSWPTTSTPTVSVLEQPQQQPKWAFHPGLLKF